MSVFNTHSVSWGFVVNTHGVSWGFVVNTHGVEWRSLVNILQGGVFNLWDEKSQLVSTELPAIFKMNRGSTCLDTTFSKDGKYFVGVGGTDNRYRVGVYNTSDWWHVGGDPVSFTSSSPFHAVSDVYRCDFSPDSRYLAFTFNTSPYFRVLDSWNNFATVTGIPAMTSALAWPSTPYFPQVRFSPNGKWMAVTNRGGPRLTVWTVADWQKVVGTPAYTSAQAPVVEFSPDSSLMAVLNYNVSPRFHLYNTSNWSIVSGTPIFSSGNGMALAFSPNGEYLAISLQWENTFGLRVYSIADWSLVFTLAGENQYVKFSHDGKYLAVVIRRTSGTDPLREVYIYETTTWSLIYNQGIGTTHDDRGICWSHSDVLHRISGHVPGYTLEDVRITCLRDNEDDMIVVTLPDIGGVNGFTYDTNLAGLAKDQVFLNAEGRYHFILIDDVKFTLVAENLVDSKPPLILGKVVAGRIS